MTLLFLALRLLLALCVVLPAAPVAAESRIGEDACGWFVAGPFCQGLPGEGRPDERLDARPDGPLDGSRSSGSDASAPDIAAPAPGGPGRRGASLEPFDDAVRGAAVAGQAFLRVNGSANANGARA